MANRPTIHYVRDVILLAALAGLSAFLAYLGAGNTITRSILALPLVFFAPGYALVLAASPRRLPEWAETLTLSLGLSLVACVLAGLALNVTPWGLHMQAEAYTMSAIVVAAATVALARHLLYTRQQLRTMLTRPSAARATPHWKVVAQIGAFTVVALLMVVTITAEIAIAQRQQTPSEVTQFWALPSTDTTQRDTILLGIQRTSSINNADSSVEAYRVEIIVGRKVTWLPTIELRANASWKSTVTLPRWSTGTAPAEIRLYRANDLSQVYRQLKLWPLTSATPTKVIGK